MSSFPDDGPVHTALDILRGKENPFESLARPQRLDDRFLDLHVPEMLAQERDLLLQVIDRYRTEEYSGSADLLQTRVVTVLGDRGSGKTHLLQSLAYREDGKSQIIVRPKYFDRDLPFEEYVLSQLAAALTEPDDVYRSRPIDDLARPLVRRLLRQAIRSMGPTDRIFALAPGRWQRLRLLWGGGRRLDRKLVALADALAPGGGDLRHLIGRHELDIELCVRLIQGHLRRFEVGEGVLASLRRALYGAMVRAVLLEETDPLFRFLDGEYAQLAAPGIRRELAARMLHALVEVCALARQPVIIAFDNLELLFSVRSQFDGELTRSFWNVLAQAVDNTRGLLVLLFAESGLLERAAGFMDSFARDRLLQGVPLFARGPVSQLRLSPPSPAAVQDLIRNRVRRSLGPLPDVERLPTSFPFPAGFLQTDGASGQNLRNTLVRLRDAYSSVVYQRAPHAPAPPPSPADLDWNSLLQSAWDRAMEHDSTPSASHLQQMHAGLAALLEPLLPFASDGWELTAVQPTLAVGDHPTYGLVSMLRWREQRGSGTCLLGIGFLLGRARGMSVDLGAKLDFFRHPSRGDRLIVLWPPTTEGDNLVELLPAATRAVWDQSRQRSRTTLRRIELSELRILMALPEWLGQVVSLPGAPAPVEAVRAFITKRCETLLHLLTLPVLQACNDEEETKSAGSTSRRAFAHEN
ncbi:MAG: hypothetical protein FJ271_31105 [Planctomycetes bacterium]|nr:hypothetical protein [Planctomycetota bacterium]